MPQGLDLSRLPQAGTDTDQGQDQDAQQPQYPHAEEIDYAIDLSPYERLKLGRRICEEIRRYRVAVAPRIEMCKEWRDAYAMSPTGRADRWEDSADVPSSMTRRYCSAASTRLNQQIVQAKPPMSVVARAPDAIDAAPYIEDAMEYVLEEAEWTVTADEAHIELPVVGNTFLRIWWDRDVIHVPVERVDVDDEALPGHLAAGADPNEALWDSLETNAQGQVKRKIQHEDRVSYTGVKYKVIPFEDGIIMPPTIRDSRQAYGIGEQTILRGDALRAGAEIGRYIPEEVDRLLQARSDDPNLSQDGYYRRQERLQEQGLQVDTGAAYSATETGDEDDALYREYQCFELCWKADWNHDGKMEWGLLTIHEPTEQVLGALYLPYEHGEPCYQMLQFLPRPGELFGMGLAELIATYQDADTALWCQFIDHNDLALNWNGNIAYTKSSGYDPSKFVAAMGRGIPVNDINGIKELPVIPLSPEAYQLRQAIKDDMDLVTASSNPSLGQVTDAKKTLGEVQIVAASANMMFEELASRVARQWKRVWDQTRWLVAQYGDGSTDGLNVTYQKAALPGRSIVVTDPETGQPVMDPQTGQPKEVPAAMVAGQLTAAPNGIAFQTIPAEMLRAKVTLIPTGLQLMSDMQSKLGQAAQVMNVLEQHPLAQQNVEVQKIALDQYLQAFHYPQREKIMAAIEQGLAQQAAMAQQQQAVEGQLAQALQPAASMAVQKALMGLLESDAKQNIGGGGAPQGHPSGGQQPAPSGPPAAPPGAIGGPPQ